MTCMFCDHLLEPGWKTGGREYDDPPFRVEWYTCGNCGKELGVAMLPFRKRSKRRVKKPQSGASSPEAQAQ